MEWALRHLDSLVLCSVNGRPTTLHLSAGWLTFVGKLQTAIADRFTQLRIHQLVDVKLHGLSRVARQIEDPCVHPDRVFRTYLDAVPAIDANTEVNVEADWVLLNVGIGMLARHNGDALSRAHCLAEHAPDAARRVVLAYGKSVAASKPRHEGSKLLGILDGSRSWKALQVAHKVGTVEQEVSEKVPERDLKATGNLWDIKLFPKRQLRSADDYCRH